jgi:SAM-dependent methyltransferase
MSFETPRLDWPEWLRRWDRQQSGNLPEREERFSAMLDVLQVLLPEQFVAIDLACGPGSISQRLLNRFPRAHCIALDFDPVLLQLGQQILGDMQGRLRWVDADLRNSTWTEQLGGEQVDAVLSTTALHWLPAETLVRLYRQLGRLVRPGGVVLNGDHLAFEPHLPSLRSVAEVAHKRHSATNPALTGTEDWQAWWDALQSEPGMETIFAERERRFLDSHHDSHTSTILQIHEAALRDAGFREVAVIWQHLDNRVVLAVR